MEMILMVAIRFGTQDRCEVSAGTGIDISQELALCTLSFPPAGNTDFLSVCQGKHTYVDCIAISMLGQFCAFHAIAGAAGKRGGDTQFHDVTAEMLSGRRLHNILHPFCGCKPDRALNICLRGQFDSLGNADTSQPNKLPFGAGTAQGG